MIFIYSLATDHPALKHLYAFIDDIATKWFYVGVELFDAGDETKLNTIKKNHPGDANECTAEMLQLWLETKPHDSWNQLLNALRMPHIKLQAVALKIEGMLSKGIMYINYFHTLAYSLH